MLNPLGALKNLWNGLMNWVPNSTFASATEHMVDGCGGVGGGSQAMGKADTVEAIYTSGKILGETMGTLPFGVFEGEGTSKKRLPDHWLAKLFNNPGLNYTRQELVEQAMHGCVITGKGPFHKVKNANGEVIQLVALEPSALEDHVLIIDGQYRRIYTYDKEVVDASDLWLPSNIWGLSPIAVLKKQISMVRGYEGYANAIMRNGAKPSGVLSHPGELTPEAKGKLKAAWREKYQGVNNSGGVIVLSEGMTWTPATISNEDLQFIEQYKFTRSLFFAVYRIPPHMAGDLDKATFSNIEHQGMEFSKYTMAPWVTRFEQSINRDFLSDEPGVYCKFNMEGLQRGDYKTRTEGNVLNVTNGLMTLDEARSLEDRPPYENDLGNKPMIPLNMQVLGEEPQEETQEPQEEIEMVNDDE